MDPRLLQYYSRELQYIREMGGEFAREYPKIAGRLGLETFECADPYVERLLEGFAFLAARVHLKLDAEFPRFTQHLLEIVYPHYLAPTPSFVNVELQPNLGESSLAQGYRVPRGTDIRSVLGRGVNAAFSDAIDADVEARRASRFASGTTRSRPLPVTARAGRPVYRPQPSVCSADVVRARLPYCATTAAVFFRQTSDLRHG